MLHTNLQKVGVQLQIFDTNLRRKSGLASTPPDFLRKINGGTQAMIAAASSSASADPEASLEATATGPTTSEPALTRAEASLRLYHYRLATERTSARLTPSSGPHPGTPPRPSPEGEGDAARWVDWVTMAEPSGDAAACRRVGCVVWDFGCGHVYALN